MKNLSTFIKPKHQTNILIAAVFMALQMPLLLLTSGTTSAAPDDKVFVCKYVGKPGADERLQTGQNPISVSTNAIKDYKGVGSYFNDKQGRSFVLMVDDKDKNTPEPAASACPAPGGGNGGDGGDGGGDVLGDSSRQATAAAGGVGAGLGGGAGSITASVIGLTASLGALGYGAVNLLRRKS